MDNASASVKLVLPQTKLDFTADYSEKRRILEITWLNCRLDDATLVPVMRKPFDVLVEGLLVPQSGG